MLNADEHLTIIISDSLLDGVDEMNNGFLSDVIEVQGNCREHLSVLNKQLVSCSRLLSNNTVRYKLYCNQIEVLLPVV